jgi:hypothetical protein
MSAPGLPSEDMRISGTEPKDCERDSARPVADVEIGHLVIEDDVVRSI